MITLLVNVSVEVNSVDPDQNSLTGSTLSKRLLKHFSRRQKQTTSDVGEALRAKYKHLYQLLFLKKKMHCIELKVHLRHLAVNFLPQYFITLLFSLTCVLTISRRKRPKSGPKTRFQSDFYTLLIICVPPIILGQVLRYFPTVVAIHMNSNVTSYDPCADAIE